MAHSVDETPTNPENERPLAAAEVAHIQLLVESFDRMRDAFLLQESTYAKWAEQIMKAVQEIAATKTLKAEVTSLRDRMADVEGACERCPLRVANGS